MEIRRTMSPAITLSADPCPFCQSPPERASLVEIARFEGMARRTLHQVVCECGAAGSFRATPTDAAFAWRSASKKEVPTIEPSVRAQGLAGMYRLAEELRA